MKITVAQLKKLIKEQIEEERWKPVRKTPFTKYVIRLGGEDGWINTRDETEETYVKNIDSIFITDAGVLSVSYKNGNTNDIDLFNPDVRNSFNLSEGEVMKMILLANAEGLIRPHNY